MYRSLIFTVTLFLFLPAQSMACLWQGGENAYWPINTIKVCFTNLNTSQRHLETAKEIESSIEELDRQTRFRFYGYGECLAEEQNEHQIRIRLEDRGVSAADFNLGPSSGLMWPSTTLPLITSNTHSIDQPQVTNTFIAWSTKHEILHLIGLLHDQERGSQAYDTVVEDIPNLVTYGDFDASTIMRSNESLSAGDLRCLEMIALRRMHLVYSGTQTTSYSNFETEVTTETEPIYIDNETPGSIK